jgi:hypothetical protein
MVISAWDLHKIPERNNRLSQYLSTRSQAEITIYFDKTISMEQQAKCDHKIRNIGRIQVISAWDLV